MATAQSVLITGGSGLVGQQLTKLLQAEGYQVMHLSRRPASGAITTYQWDVKAGTLDERALETADHIIHLAGAGIADKRWTKRRRQEIMDSRVAATALLTNQLALGNHQVQSFISASAIGYYGDRGAEVLTEESTPGRDGFLEDVCVAWEQAADAVAALGIRTVKIRIGLVLAMEGGALPKVLLPMRFGLAPYFGNGQQYYSWIHIHDLVRLFHFMLTRSSLSGVYNAVAPTPMTNKAFTRVIATAYGRPTLLLPAPRFALRTAMGEMADVVLYSARVSAQKTLKAGFSFGFPALPETIHDLLRTK